MTSITTQIHGYEEETDEKKMMEDVLVNVKKAHKLHIKEYKLPQSFLLLCSAIP